MKQTCYWAANKFQSINKFPFFCGTPKLRIFLFFLPELYISTWWLEFANLKSPSLWNVSILSSQLCINFGGWIVLTVSRKIWGFLIFPKRDTRFVFVLSFIQCSLNNTHKLWKSPLYSFSSSWFIFLLNLDILATIYNNEGHTIPWQSLRTVCPFIAKTSCVCTYYALQRIRWTTLYVNL